MRIGVNSGSLPKHLHALERENSVEALVTAGVEFVELMERLDFTDFKVSIKSTNVPNTIAANRLLSERIPYPLHLGITEAGTKWSGSLKSAVGLGTLLADGIGDTIRISLSTFHAEEEVKVAWEILKALKLRERGPVLIACPTCGRLQFDMDTVVADIEKRLEAYADPVEVAVLGCAVNGIGEASHADFGITGAKNEGLIFSRGKALKKVPQEQLVDELFKEIDKYTATKRIDVDAAEQAAGAEWLRADRGGERRRADARAPRQARGRAGARGRRQRSTRRWPRHGAASRSTRTPRRPTAAASPAPERAGPSQVRARRRLPRVRRAARRRGGARPGAAGRRRRASRSGATGICRSDWHAWMGHDPDVAPPHVPGHELAGTVVAVGAEVRGRAEGERVTVPFCLGCGRCAPCRAGETQICDDDYQPGFTGPGLVRAVRRAAARRPEPRAAAGGARLRRGGRARLPLHDRLRGGDASTGGRREGDWVAVHGCGGVGLVGGDDRRGGGRARGRGRHRPARSWRSRASSAPRLAIDARDGDAAAAVREATGGGAHVSLDALGSAGDVRRVGRLAAQARPPRPGRPDARRRAQRPGPDEPRDLARARSSPACTGWPCATTRRCSTRSRRARSTPRAWSARRCALEQAGAELAAMGGFARHGATVIALAHSRRVSTRVRDLMLASARDQLR